MENATTTYNKGDMVVDEGTYVCVPCGFRKHFKQGDHFSECTSCMAGSPKGHDDYVEGLELWERANDAVPPKA